MKPDNSLSLIRYFPDSGFPFQVTWHTEKWDWTLNRLVEEPVQVTLTRAIGFTSSFHQLKEADSMEPKSDYVNQPN